MLVLASRSPRRQEILRQAGIAFKARAAEVDETRLAGEKPEEYGVPAIAGIVRS
jgi:septum formation protein